MLPPRAMLPLRPLMAMPLAMPTLMRPRLAPPMVWRLPRAPWWLPRQVHW
jgi:hypothetical protein